MELTKSLKVKVGIFFGYNGQKFLGLQYQRDTENTVQNILHKVFCDQGFVLKTNMQNLKRIKWSRAGRTDKRVHALCNGISVSLEFDGRYVLDWQTRTMDMEKVVNDINVHLPQDIKIFAIKKVGKAFDMRHDTCSRIYNYICPLKLFMSKRELAEGKVLNELEKEELLAKVNNLAKLYLGTHSFNNFTKGYKPNDPRCDRYIMDIGAEPVEQEVVDNSLAELFQNQEDRKTASVSFLRFTLVGQSFIYHQIRKMIGLLVRINYEELNGEETIKKAFGQQKFDVYLAPGEGLYLNRMTFSNYNKKKESQHRVILTEQDEAKILKYRTYLESKILSHQFKDKVFTNWLENHDKWQKADQSQAEPSDRE